MKSNFCIVIPIYKKELSPIEDFSLKRMIKMIGKKNYPIYFVKPESLDIKNYKKILKNVKVQEVCFDEKYFESIRGYSQLCLSYDFYNKFSNYEYMYIYQLDCYLLEDNLDEWCKLGYDYIGGPILSTGAGWDTYDKEKNYYEPRVGNGGFSLRKISVFKDLTDPNGEFRTYYKLTDDIISKVIYEDKYFCNDLYKYYELELPHWVIASRFSWDMNVDLYNKFFNIKYLPMACHAWDRNIRFWKNVFEELKDKDKSEVVDYCEEKHKELFKKYYTEDDETIKYV